MRSTVMMTSLPLSQPESTLEGCFTDEWILIFRFRFFRHFCEAHVSVHQGHAHKPTVFDIW